jgi:hypothetical protein
MNTLLTAFSPIEALEQKRMAQAKDEGFALFFVKGDDVAPAFVYTVGMAQHKLPDILMFVAADQQFADVGNYISKVCQSLIFVTTKFNFREALSGFGARMKDSPYTLNILQDESYKYTMSAYTTRTWRFKDEFGIPTILEIQQPDVVTLDQVCAMKMLASS